MQTMTPRPANPAIDFEELGARLRAFRLGSNHKADDIAQMLGISRAAVYRMEKGEISKIETLGKLAGILESSLPSLMGVGTEYYSSAVAYIERMRQLEHGTKRILAHFDPISILLVSDDFVGYLEKMLRESRNGPTDGDIKLLVDLLRDRRKTYSSKPAPIVSLIGLRELERMVHFGFIGRMDLPDDVRRERIKAKPCPAQPFRCSKGPQAPTWRSAPSSSRSFPTLPPALLQSPRHRRPSRSTPTWCRRSGGDPTRGEMVRQC